MTSTLECMDLHDLEHRQLGAVVFERDAVRLQFDGPEVVLRGPFNVSLGEGSVAFGRPGTRDLLRSRIAKTVLRVDHGEGPWVDLWFDDGRRLTLTPGLAGE